MSQKVVIREMLVNGVSPGAISQTLGVSESYISQLANDEDFAAELAQARTTAASEDLSYDNRLDDVESGFLDIIQNKARFANLQQSVQAFTAINKARRRRESGNHAPVVGHGAIVNITVPVVLMPQYIKNNVNEIVEVEGQTMISASPKALDTLLQQRPSTVPQLQTGMTRVVRAEGVLQNLDNKPVRRLTRNVKDSEIADLL